MKKKSFFLKSFFLLCLSLLVFGTSGFSCTLFQKTTKGQTGDPTTPIELVYWRVFDEQDSMQDIIQAYQQLHPNVTITYRKFRYEEYEQELLNALAEERGPDLLSIHNTWTGAYEQKLLPVPKKLAVGYMVTKGSLKKTTVPEIREVAGISPKQIREDYVDTVADDVIREDQVYGLPLSVDTMALFYNKDLFNAAGIVIPPKTWEEFKTAVISLTRINAETDEIEQAGAAFGAVHNIQRASDIVSTLMMQSGTQMTNGESITIDSTPPYLVNAAAPPATDALRFYTDFAAATPRTEVYTWNDQQPDSFEAFTQGKAAMFFGYSYHRGLLGDVAPHIRYGVVPLPQINPARPVAPANYWVEAVSKKTKTPDTAWDFLMFAARAEQARTYLEKTDKPAALRSLIPDQLQKEGLASFASQLLFARNWYHGHDPLGAERAFESMIIDALATKGGTPEDEQGKIQEVISRAKHIIEQGY